MLAWAEVRSRLESGADGRDRVGGVCRSVAAGVASLAKGAGVRERVCVSGGVARNAGVRNAMARELGVPIVYDERAQLMGALGAALYAYEKTVK